MPASPKREGESAGLESSGVPRARGVPEEPQRALEAQVPSWGVWCCGFRGLGLEYPPSTRQFSSAGVWEMLPWDFPGGASDKEPTCQCMQELEKSLWLFCSLSVSSPGPHCGCVIQHSPVTVPTLHSLRPPCHFIFYPINAPSCWPLER